jgi:hypothetical protein
MRLVKYPHIKISKPRKKYHHPWGYVIGFSRTFTLHSTEHIKTLRRQVSYIYDDAENDRILNGSFYDKYITLPRIGEVTQTHDKRYSLLMGNDLTVHETIPEVIQAFAERVESPNMRHQIV